MIFNSLQQDLFDMSPMHEFKLQYRDRQGVIQSVTTCTRGWTREKVKTSIMNNFRSSFFGCELIHIG